MATGSEVITAAATRLNDFGLRTFNKERLFHHLVQAHKKMQVKLLRAGIPVIKEKSSIIDVAIGATDLGDDQPSNLIEPIRLWERRDGTTDNFVPMIEKGWEPEEQQADALRYWVWRKELILFLGATTARDVKIYYKGGIDLPTQEGDPLGFLFAENYLGPMTAALAAQSLGNMKVFETLRDEADLALDDVIGMNIIGQQALPARRRPYGRARRQYI